MECQETKGAGECNEIVAKICPYKGCAAKIIDKINSISEKSDKVEPRVPDVKDSKIEE